MTTMPPRYDPPCPCSDWEPEYACLGTQNCIKPAQWAAWNALPPIVRGQYSPADMPTNLFDPVEKFSDMFQVDQEVERKICEWPHGCTRYAQRAKEPQKYELCNICNNRVHKRRLRGLDGIDLYAPSKKSKRGGR
jgi:hypothetical protein